MASGYGVIAKFTPHEKSLWDASLLVITDELCNPVQPPLNLMSKCYVTPSVVTVLLSFLPYSRRSDQAPPPSYLLGMPEHSWAPPPPKGSLVALDCELQEVRSRRGGNIQTALASVALVSFCRHLHKVLWIDEYQDTGIATIDH